MLSSLFQGSTLSEVVPSQHVTAKVPAAGKETKRQASSYLHGVGSDTGHICSHSIH